MSEKRTSPISHLPEEILSEIFIQYACGSSRLCAMDFAQRHVNSVYQRAYTLLGVCATWRRVGLACPDLWKLVAITNQKDAGPRAPNELILRRAAGNDLHLVFSDKEFRQGEFKVLDDHWHRFGRVSIQSESESSHPAEISKVLGPIIEHSSPGSISKLCLSKMYGSANYDLAEFEPHIYQLIGSLAVFRINRMHICWKNIAFSHRFVELCVAHIGLRNNSEILGFFAAISSTRELKVLKLIAILFDPSQLETESVQMVSLPMLKFLYIERSYLNILDYIMSRIARGSYHLMLTLSTSTPRKFPLGVEPNDVEYFFAFLRGVPVDELTLRGRGDSPWSHSSGLQRVLKSIPGLKALVIDEFIVNRDILMGFERPPTLYSPMDNDAFPTLTRLEFHAVSFAVSLSELKPGFETILNTHQLQTLVLGGTLRPAPGINGTPLDENDEVVVWMRLNVPRVCVSFEPGREPYNSNWELWDI
ncbi:unnamed protein product [Rhizoctonia solani]|uniref:F-box domain-containing protein n=1 Tax=Rhizoctonia solani TaxID=456999 RepID=A0A8H3DUU9_9AGAM|nr:unnamed protein product [Rhizoctonia solani]CAE7051771.1 unnamed protein product [Rhizoctonia solani]